MAASFCLDWFSGASAQVELFSPKQEGDDALYQLKYTPAFRSTIRPPVEERPLGPGDLEPINAQLDQLVTTIGARFGGAGAAPPAIAPGKSIEAMEMLGQQLLSLVLPQYVQGDLRASDMFLEIGMDESLLEYPWELMHDGDNFLCLKHAIGRFVNGAGGIPAARQPFDRAAQLDELSILLVSVPAPQPRQNQDKIYDPLPEAEAETQAILDALKGLPNVKVSVLIGKNATYNELFRALKAGTYQIVHFNGHAFFREDRPRESALVLHDQDMKTGAVIGYFGKRPPVLCFVNACETAKVGKWNGRYDIFGLARAFLETGAYLLGSRWRINDKAAAEFATKFYTALIGEGKAVGTAMLEARRLCKASAQDEFAWASYMS